MEVEIAFSIVRIEPFVRGKMLEAIDYASEKSMAPRAWALALSGKTRKLCLRDTRL